MIDPIDRKTSSNDRELVASVSLLTLRTSQYRQRIEVLEALLRESETRRLGAEKQIEQMLDRISAVEAHCTWSTEELRVVTGRLDEGSSRSAASRELKKRLALPLVRLATMGLVRAANLAPRLRDSAAFWLHTRRPGLYNKLKSVAPAAFEMLEKDARSPDWQARLRTAASAHQAQGVPPLREVRNTREAALANPLVANLPRPLDAVLEMLNVPSERKDEHLQEVTQLGQARKGTVSVGFVVFVNGQSASALDSTLQSVFRQTDPTWELLLCSDQVHHEPLADWLDRDWRIRRVPVQQSEVEALIAAANLSTSLFLGLISPGDVVDDDLVKRIGQLAKVQGDLAAVYTDEAGVGPDGSECGRFHKPGWSPDHLLSANVLGRFLGIRKSILLTLPRESWQSTEVAEYLLSLRLLDQSAPVGHLEEVLYLRQALSEDAQAPLVGGLMTEQALQAAAPETQAHLRQSRDPGAIVLPDAETGALRVRWSIPTGLPVTLVILSNMRYRTSEGRGSFLMVLNFVNSIIAKSTYPNYRILVVDDGYVPDELANVLHEHGHSTATYRAEGAFSFAGKSNFATSLVPSGIVVLLNDDLEVVTPDWIEALVEQASRPEVGVAGGKLLFPDGSIQHAGIAIGMNGSAGHVFMGHPSDAAEYGRYASVIRNYGAVTGALMAYRREVFDILGGFDEFFRVDYNDIDFCLRCIARGFRVVFTPYAKLYHFHNSTFNRKHDLGHERAEFLRRWQSVVDHDPYCGARLIHLCREEGHRTS